MKKAILSDRVGSGKTLSILYSFAYLREQGILNNLLVLTPLSAYEKETWKKDLDTFTELSYASVDEIVKELKGDLTKVPEILKQYSVIYGKHTQMKSMLLLLRNIVIQPGVMLCIDELHAFKNPKSELTYRCKQLTDKIPYFWGMTGSSISKSPEDLYTLVNLVSPYYLGGFLQFRDKYCKVTEKVTGRRFDGKLNKAKVISGFKEDMEEVLQQKLEPLLIKGESFFDVHFHYLNYVLSKDETSLYHKLAKGINLKPEASDEDWLATVLGADDVENAKSSYIRDVERFSSRFVYLQYAADGVLNRDGTFDNCHSSKIDLLISTLRDITSKGQSTIVYFDYYAPLHAVQARIAEEGLNCDVLESSGSNVLSADDVTEERCKKKPVVILGTKASSESVSYYMLNHVIFFDVPTMPATFVQTVGRITRKNSLYPDDLNVHIFRSENIDLYKMMLVSCRTYQLELVQGKEKNVPDDYKCIKDRSVVDSMKRTLLWCNDTKLRKSFSAKKSPSYKEISDEV